MPNPIMNGSPAQPIPSFQEFISNIQNPQAYVNQMLQQNPQARQFFSSLQNSANGRSPREMAMQLAKQRGIPPEQLNQIVSRFNH